MEKTVLILVLMEWRWNKNKKTMKKNSIFCLNPCSNGMALEQSYILMICGCVLSPDFLHSPYFQLLNMYFRHFFANASIFQQQIVLFASSFSFNMLIINTFILLKSSQMLHS